MKLYFLIRNGKVKDVSNRKYRLRSQRGDLIKCLDLIESHDIAAPYYFCPYCERKCATKRSYVCPVVACRDRDKSILF